MEGFHSFESVFSVSQIRVCGVVQTERTDALESPSLQSFFPFGVREFWRDVGDRDLFTWRDGLIRPNEQELMQMEVDGIGNTGVIEEGGPDPHKPKDLHVFRLKFTARVSSFMNFCIVRRSELILS